MPTLIELIARLEADIEEILFLRNENHYRRGRPDEEDDYDPWDDENSDAWVSFTNANYDNNNRIGAYLHEAENTLNALKKALGIETEPTAQLVLIEEPTVETEPTAEQPIEATGAK